MLKISEQAYSFSSNAVLVTGSARSGTTIVGKIIHTFRGVEYAYEPPMLFSLFALIERMNEQDWRLLYETYLYEEFMLNALAGRSINCNQSDDSSIYNVKPLEEIEARLQRSLPKAEAEILAKCHTVAYKIPDIIPYVSKLTDYYPGTRVVVTMREAVGTINSLMQKKWFNEANANSNLIWPFRIHEGTQIPFWVREEDDDLWLGLSELDRSAYYYIRVNENVNKIAGRITVSYTQLVRDPGKTVGELAERLGLKFGAITERILQEVKLTRPVRDDQIISGIHPSLREQVMHYSGLSE